MAVTVEQMMVENSRWMRRRCKWLERMITSAIRRKWSPGRTATLRPWPFLIDDYTVAEMRRRFPDWEIGTHPIRQDWRPVMWAKEREPIPLDESPFR
jgi:hypothetical protein